MSYIKLQTASLKDKCRQTRYPRALLATSTRCHRIQIPLSRGLTIRFSPRYRCVTKRLILNGAVHALRNILQHPAMGL